MKSVILISVILEIVFISYCINGSDEIVQPKTFAEIYIDEEKLNSICEIFWCIYSEILNIKPAYHTPIIDIPGKAVDSWDTLIAHIIIKCLISHGMPKKLVLRELFQIARHLPHYISLHKKNGIFNNDDPLGFNLTWKVIYESQGEISVLLDHLSKARKVNWTQERQGFEGTSSRQEIEEILINLVKTMINRFRSLNSSMSLNDPDIRDTNDIMIIRFFTVLARAIAASINSI